MYMLFTYTLLSRRNLTFLKDEKSMNVENNVFWLWSVGVVYYP